MSEGHAPKSTDSRLVEPDHSPPGQPHSQAVRGEGSTVAPRNLEPSAPSEDYEKLQQRYASLESERGRLGNEVGQLRKELEGLRAPKAEEAPADYWTDPEKAIESRLRPFQEKLAGLEAEKLRAELRAIHPDYSEVVKRPEFGEWVKERRSRTLLAISGEAGDVGAAAELLDEYKAGLESGNSTPKEAVRRDRLARASTTEKGSPKRPTGQVYKRGELQNLRAFNPRRYEELLPDIKRAYTDGRVVD